MKRLVPIILLVAMLPGWAWANPAIYQRLDTGIFQLYVKEFGSLTAICSSGAVWTDGKTTRLLTAGHCIVNENVRFAVTRDGLTFKEAKVILRGWKARDAGFAWQRLLKSLPTVRQTFEGNDVSDGDWGLLVVEGKLETIPLGSSKGLQMGDELFAIGFPVGGDKVATRGIVGNPEYAAPGLPWNGYIAANIPALPGNSGTPIVNAKGEVVAILVAGAGDNLHLLTPIDLIKEKAKCLTEEVCPQPKPAP